VHEWSFSLQNKELESKVCPDLEISNLIVFLHIGKSNLGALNFKFF
jgi:hypothetical protein